MPRKARVVERALLRKGFRPSNSKHRWFHYYKINGERGRISTLMSHGADRDISDGMLAEMARQLHLTRRQFDELIDCRLSQADYEAMLRRDGLVR